MSAAITSTLLSLGNTETVSARTYSMHVLCIWKTRSAVMLSRR